MSSLSRRDFVAQSTGCLAPMIAASLLMNATSQSLLAQNSTRIRVGQIGTKHGHASGKLQALKKLSDLFEVIGVVEEDPAQKEKVHRSDPYVDCNWMTTDELLKHDGLQLVFVETDIDQLLTTAEKCLLAGMHIHLDKPAGASMEHFRRVAQIAADKKRVIQLGYMFRSNPAFQFMFDAVKNGWLGEIFEIDCVMSKALPVNERAEVARFRGGSMFELGCHLIDAVITLLGKPQSIHPFNLKTYPERDSLNDNCLAIFQYPKATATIRSSMVEVDGNRRRQFTICGTQGTIEIEPLEPHKLLLTIDRPRGEFRKGTQSVTLPKSTGRYDGDLRDLALAIRGEREYGYSLEHDLLVQESVLKASEML